MRIPIAAAFALLSWQANAEVGIASVDDGKPTRFDGGRFHGRLATGARFTTAGFTLAHRTLPLGSCVEVRSGNRVVPVAKVDDRGPCATASCQRRAPWLLKRIADLKPRLARVLGCDGLCRVTLRETSCGKAS